MKPKYFVDILRFQIANMHNVDLIEHIKSSDSPERRFQSRERCSQGNYKLDHQRRIASGDILVLALLCVRRIHCIKPHVNMITQKLMQNICSYLNSISIMYLDDPRYFQD